MMEIVSLFGAMPNQDKGLYRVTAHATGALKELGMSVSEINLGNAAIPIYDGTSSNVVASIASSIKSASGIIMSTTSSSVGYSSVLQVFLEHLEMDYRDILKQKNCMLMMTAKDLHGQAQLNSLATATMALGGHDSIRMLIDEKHSQIFGQDSAFLENVEKQVEDFYRIVRQKRNFYMPGIQQPVAVPQAHTAPLPAYVEQPAVDISLFNTQPQPQQAFTMPMPPVQNDLSMFAPPTPPTPPPPLVPPPMPQAQANPYSQSAGAQMYQQQPAPLPTPQPMQQDVVYTPSTPPPQQPQQPMSGYNAALDNFNNKQQDDIQEITQFFSKKYKDSAEELPTYQAQGQDYAPSLSPMMPNMPTMPRGKTCRQLSASLVHYFQPTLAKGLSCVMQLNISGAEGFNGYIVINNTDCHFVDGVAENPTITIISEDRIWSEVVTGKSSAQKVFMTGGLKIKGNFVLLTKFDQMFDTSNNIA